MIIDDDGGARIMMLLQTIGANRGETIANFIFPVGGFLPRVSVVSRELFESMLER